MTIVRVMYQAMWSKGWVFGGVGWVKGAFSWDYGGKGVAEQLNKKTNAPRDLSQLSRNPDLTDILIKNVRFSSPKDSIKNCLLSSTKLKSSSL